MSKRGQEQTSNEGSAMAKPKPMSPVHTKAKSRNLVSQASHGPSRWSERSDSTTALNNHENPRNALTNAPDVNRGSGRPEHDGDTSDNVKHSQVKKTGKCSEHRNFETSKGLLTLTVASGNGMNITVNTIDTVAEFCNMRVTDFDYIQTIFRILHTKLGDRLEDQHHDVFFFHVFVNDGSNSSCTELREESGDLQVHEF